MKNKLNHLLLALLFSISAQFLIAGQDTLYLVLVDGYTNEAMPNKKVNIKATSKKGANLISVELTSDAEGRIKFAYNKTNYLTIRASLNDIDFLNADRVIYSNHKNPVWFHFYPSLNYEARMLVKEDELYGRVSFEGWTYEGEDDTSKDNEAVFPGGDKALANFIAVNVVYPDVSIEMNEQGKVFCGFVVEEDGFVSHVTVLKRVSTDLDREAVRLVRATKRWIPGVSEDGTVLRAKCIIPINFTLK